MNQQRVWVHIIDGSRARWSEHFGGERWRTLGRKPFWCAQRCLSCHHTKRTWWEAPKSGSGVPGCCEEGESLARKGAWPVWIWSGVSFGLCLGASSGGAFYRVSPPRRCISMSDWSSCHAEDHAFLSSAGHEPQVSDLRFLLRCRRPHISKGFDGKH